jgi:hypothetical protein
MLNREGKKKERREMQIIFNKKVGLVGGKEKSGLSLILESPLGIEGAICCRI